MRSRYRISLNGIHLDTLDNNLLILDIGYSSVIEQVTQSRVALLDGYDFQNGYIDRQTVTVTFELHIYDVAKRNEACQKVNAWAKAGGTLITNDRAGQRLLYTRCEQFASIESARNWTDPLTLVFATTYVPYWQSVNAKTLTISGKSASGTLKMDGNYGKAPLTVDVVAGGKVTAFKITAGESVIQLKGLDIPNKGTLTISHTDNRFLRIRTDKSVLSKLDPSVSTDLLVVPCGENTKISISADNKVTATITARGYWL